MVNHSQCSLLWYQESSPTARQTPNIGGSPRLRHTRCTGTHTNTELAYNAYKNQKIQMLLKVALDWYDTRILWFTI